MQPKLELLSSELTSRILDEAFQLMMNPGIRVLSQQARDLLTAAGVQIDATTNVARIPEKTVRTALSTVPHEFYLYNRLGERTVTYGGNNVQFDPGSSSVSVLDPDTLKQKPAHATDLIRLVKVAEMLPQYEAQSTAVVCDDVPKEIGDLYRLYIVLMHSIKPVVTGSFTNRNLQAMIEMLALFAGDRASLANKPQAVFDVCPNPPLTWGNFAADNIVALAQARMPAEMVSMPLAGAAAPVTLLGAITQHAAECLSGITIHQLAGPGSPIVWGGAPAIFDMRKGHMSSGRYLIVNIHPYAQGVPVRLPKAIRVGAAIVLVAVIAFASAAYGRFWLELPAVILTPILWWAVVHLPERSYGLSAIPFAHNPGQHRVTMCAPGADRAGVIYVVVCSLNVGLGEAQRLLSRMPAVLVRGVSAEAAFAFASRLEAAGAGVTVGTE